MGIFTNTTTHNTHKHAVSEEKISILNIIEGFLKKVPQEESIIKKSLLSGTIEKIEKFDPVDGCLDNLAQLYAEARRILGIEK